MSAFSVLAPVFVMIAMTFGLLIATGLSRTKAIKRREVTVAAIALGQSAWPDRTMQISNSFHNQLELPLLYYALVAFVLITQQANSAFLFLSWVFVASRIVHVFVHTTSNNVLLRFQVFIAGVIILALMWVLFAIRLL